MKTKRTKIRDLAQRSLRTLSPDEAVLVNAAGAYPTDTFATTWSKDWGTWDVEKIDGPTGSGGGSGGGHLPV